MDEKIIEYINSLNSNNNNLNVLYKEIINFENTHFIPAVSFEVACFLRLFTGILQPKRILEIGFGSGVSSIFLNKAKSNSENFVSLERDKNRYDRGIKLLEKYNVSNIDLKHIDAFVYLKTLVPEFDLIFLDGVKREYFQYISYIKYIMKKGGVLIADNILFGGKVIYDKVDKKYQDGVKYLKLFNKMISEDKSFNTTFFKIGDGISISIKQ